MDLSKLSKKKKELSPVEMAAKMSVVNSLRNEAMKSMGSKLDGLNKVSVTAKDKEGLSEGLDKAKELLSKSPEGLEEQSEDEGMEPEESEGEASPAEAMEEEAEEAAMSPEELDAKIQELMARKASLLKK